MDMGLSLILILGCMCGGAFFSGIETGLISIHRMRLRHFVRQGSPGAALLQEFLDNPDRLLGTTLVGNNICVVVTSVVAASLASRILGEWGEPVSAVVVSLTLLTFCEYLPKAWFHSRPLDRCRRFVTLLRVAELALRPVAILVVGLTRLLVRGPSQAFSKPAPFVTREDLKLLARDGEKDGVLSPEERVMIHRVMELSGKRARQIMIPREKMVFVDTDATLSEVFEKARQSGYTRMPLFDKAEGQFTGIANVFYALSTHPVDMNQTAKDFARPPLLIPEHMPVDDIFPRLRRLRQPMALVTADSGEVIGLVTTEDILGEIVGKL